MFKKLHRKELIIRGLIVFCFLLFFLLKQYNLIDFFSLPSTFEKLAKAPYTLISYAFLHSDLMHLLFNMCFLYFSAKLFFNWFSEFWFLLIYFLGLIFSGLFFVFIMNFSSDELLLGASAGVTTIFFFAVARSPFVKISLFSRIDFPLWVLAISLVILDFLWAIFFRKSGNWVHLWAAFLGVLLFHIFQRNHFFKFSKIKRKKKSIRTKKTLISSKDLQIQQQMKAILQKISKSGYQSLTQEEKKFLFQASSNLQKNNAIVKVKK